MNYKDLIDKCREATSEYHFQTDLRYEVDTLADALEKVLLRLELAEEVCEGVVMYAAGEVNEKLLKLHYEWMIGKNDYK